MSTDLDVATPEEVAKVLRAAADKYRESAMELASTWGDSHAGKVWKKMATRLDRCADGCEREVQALTRGVK